MDPTPRDRPRSTTPHQPPHPTHPHPTTTRPPEPTANTDRRITASERGTWKSTSRAYIPCIFRQAPISNSVNDVLTVNCRIVGTAGVEGFLMTYAYRITTSARNPAEGVVLISDNAHAADTIPPSAHCGDDQAI